MYRFPAMMALGIVTAGSVTATARDNPAPTGCAQLCGKWVLDESRSDPVAQVVDDALKRYRVPRQNGPRMPRTGEPPPTREQAPAEEGNAGGAADPGGEAPEAGKNAGGEANPGSRRPYRSNVREDLLAGLTPPSALAFSDKGREILVRAGDGPERRIFPGERHSRVDSRGTAHIRAEWKKGVLAVREDFGGKRSDSQAYTLLPDGTLQLSLELDRPGIKQLRLRAVYRREEAGR